MTCSLVTQSPKQTERAGEKLAGNLKGGEAIELISDLGGGKTTLTRGIARGLGSSDHVSSPTFKISNVYKNSSGLALWHFDFHRLNDAGIAAFELNEVLNDPGSVAVIEWADTIRDVLPSNLITVRISPGAGNQRTLEFSCPKELDYALEGLCTHS